MAHLGEGILPQSQSTENHQYIDGIGPKAGKISFYVMIIKISNSLNNIVWLKDFHKQYYLSCTRFVKYYFNHFYPT